MPRTDDRVGTDEQRFEKLGVSLRLVFEIFCTMHAHIVNHSQEET